MTTIEARIWLTYSYGASIANSCDASIVIVLFSSSKSIATFKCRITSFIVNTSERIGTFVNVVVPSSANKLAAKIGRTAFFAPSIFTVPVNRLPP